MPRGKKKNGGSVPRGKKKNGGSVPRGKKKMALPLEQSHVVIFRFTHLVNFITRIETSTVEYNLIM